MTGMTISIPADIALGEYNITVKATGSGDYNTKTGATFKLNITPIALTRLNIDDVSVTRGTPSFVISPTLIPTGATAVYSLINAPTGVSINGNGTLIYIDVFGIHNITVKAIGTGEYSGESETTFRLTIPVPDDNFVIDFIDRNFKNNVKSDLNITSNEVTYGDVKDITDLDIANGRIHNMEEIRYFTALKNLNYGSNLLTSLDISQNTVLEKLDCQQNRLISLDISQNTALTKLNCIVNQLTNLDLSRNTVLKELYCYDNRLISLDLSQNTVLKELYCYDNRLTSLDLSRNTVLEKLYCSNNPLTSLDIRGMRRVNKLIINNTTLQTLKVHQNIKDQQNIIDLKTDRGSNITISTYNAPPGSTNYQLDCPNYTPDIGGGTCSP